MKADIMLERRVDGTLILGNSQPLGDYEKTMVDWLEIWADRHPGRTFIAERKTEGGWHTLSYAQALDGAMRTAGRLLELGANTERPLAILSGNSIASALAMLGGLYAGIPVSPVSPAYALMSQDFEKLASVFGTLQPGVVFVEDGLSDSKALAEMRRQFDFELLAMPLASQEISRTRVSAARRSVNGETIAKILFTSGSTGAPKGVINTHSMWSANQQQIAHAWPFLFQEPPVLLDWLPWNHTFGGNHNFGLVLRHGGTLYIDDGKATESGIARTVENLSTVSPTLYMNVPKGYDLLVPHLENNALARRSFFQNLRLIESAAAALPAHLAEKLRALGAREGRKTVPVVTGWGATETSPGVTVTPLDLVSAKGIGLPMRGIQIKLVPTPRDLSAPSDDTYELRVRGPNVTTGYWGRPELKDAAFDEEGFYRMGDRGRFVDPDQPELGLEFAGRTAEEFKLSTGTWVQVTAFRLKAIEAFSPLVQDVVIAGANQDFVSLLLFMNWNNCRQFAGPDGSNLSEAQLAQHHLILDAVRHGLVSLSRGGGSSTSAARCLIEINSPSPDKGEITDKGYLSQAGVLRCRSDSVRRLYAPQPGAGVITR